MPRTSKNIKFKATLTRSTLDTGWHFLVIGRRIADKFPVREKTRRVICSINGAKPFPCALMPWGDEFYIMVNKARRAALGIEAGDKVSVELTPDDSKYGMPMPAELKEVLKQDREGNRFFHALTAGKQRSLLYYIGKIRTIDGRIHAALIVMEHLKKNDGKLDGETLYHELKRPIAEF